MKKIDISWSRTEEFSGTYEVEDDFDPEDNEALEELVGGLEHHQLNEAFDNCPNLEVTYNGEDKS